MPLCAIFLKKIAKYIYIPIQKVGGFDSPLCLLIGHLSKYCGMSALETAPRNKPTSVQGHYLLYIFEPFIRRQVG